MRHADLELVPLAVADQRRALVEGEVDAALVRQPLDGETLSVIPLYDEQAVVVCAKDSHLTAGDELVFADLEGEVLIVPQDDALGILPAAPPLAAGASSGASGRVGPSIPGTVAPRFASPADTAEAIATVAAGVGIVIVPMSIARLHQRKDVDYRLLREGPVSSVALAWPTDRTTPAVEAFVGIVRGRTANSSRG
jgi:DNA-binding transcriptional LysR family regulator